MKNILTATYHSRKTFYHGKDIYWYRFFLDDEPLTDDARLVPIGFIRVPETVYFEFGGEVNEAINSLMLNKFDVIKEGIEI